VATWLRSLPCDPLVRVLEADVPEDQLPDAEGRWIRVMRGRGAPLMNVAEVK